MQVSRWVVSLLWLLLAASPLLGGPVYPVAPPASGPMPFISSSVSVAFGPEGGLAVWRIGSGSIWGVPLDPDGRPTAPARRIFADGTALSSPAVTHTHGSFRLWWVNGYPSVTRTALLEDDGTVRETKTLDRGVSAPRAWNHALGIAFSRSGYDVTAQFFDRELDIVRSEAVTEVGAVYGVAGLVLADGSFAAVTAGWSGLYLTRFSEEGERIGPPLLIEASVGTTATAYRPHWFSAATDGDSLLVVWSAGAHDELPDLKKVLVARDDTLSARETLVSDRWKRISDLDAAWADGAYTVVFGAGQFDGFEPDDFDLHALRLAATGEVSEPPAPLVVRDGVELDVKMETSGGRHLVFFQQGDYGMGEVFAVSLPTMGPIARQDPAAIDARLSDSAAWQSASVAASDGTGWLVAWVEKIATSEQIRSAPLGPDGAPTAPPSTLASVPRYIGAPAVAFNGVDFIVAWMEGGALLAKRIGRDGTPIDASPLVVAGIAAGSHVSMAAKDGLALLAWGAGTIRGALLHASGAPSPAFDVSPESSYSDEHVSLSYENPLVSAGADGFLVAWRQRRTEPCVGVPCPTSTKTQARIVSRDGSVLSSLISFDERAPFSAASSGGTHLLTFDSGRSVIVDGTTGEVSAPFSIFRSAHGSVRALATGGEYLVAFRARGSALPLVRRVSPDGSLGTIHAVDAFTLPSAASDSGALLAIGADAILSPPFLGATAIQAQVAIPSGPITPTPRRRGAKR